jgi:hypothetical protein
MKRQGTVNIACDGAGPHGQGNVRLAPGIGASGVGPRMLCLRCLRRERAERGWETRRKREGKNG